MINNKCCVIGTFEFEVTLDESVYEWHDDYNDPTSTKFQELAKALEDELNSINTIPGVIFEVVGFVQGSVKAE